MNNKHVILGVTIARKVLLWIHRQILKPQIYLKTKYKIIFIWLTIHLHVPIRATKRGEGRGELAELPWAPP